MKSLGNQLNVLRPLLRGVPVILFTAMCGLWIANRYLRYVTPEYESTVKIKLADSHEGVPNTNLYKDFDVFATSNKIGAEVELLKSSSLLQKVASRLSLHLEVFRVGELHNTELYDRSPFIVTSAFINEKWRDRPIPFTVTQDSLLEVRLPDGSVERTMMGREISNKNISLLIAINTNYLNKRPDLKVNDNYECILYSDRKLVNDMIARLDVMSVDKDVPVLRISYKSSVPSKASDIVNTLAATYIEDYIESKFKSADTTGDFLNKQLKAYSNSLAASENAIESYRDRNHIVNIRQETETDLRKIADLKKQLASVKMNLNAIDSLNTYIKNGKQHFLTLAPNFEAFTDLLSTELVKKTKELQREKHELLLKYTPEHEKVKVIDDKLNDINRYLEESIKNTGENLRIKYNELSENIAESEKVFDGLPTREKNMAVLERNFGLNEQIYRFLHEKRTEAEIAKAATISFHRIISPGEPAVKPVSPNVGIIKILAVILGIFSGISLVYGIHALKARVNDELTINRLSAIPVAASVPFFEKKARKNAFFQRWVLQMELKGLLNKGSVVVLSSFKQGGGSDFISAGLHQELRRMGRKVTLLNVAALGLESSFTPEAFRSFVEEEKAKADIILFNNFPIHDEPAAIVPIAAADFNLIVLDSRRTKKECITETNLLQEELKTNEMQFVLNRAGFTPSLARQCSAFILLILKQRVK